MPSVRHRLIGSGVLAGILLLSAPLFVSYAQETTDGADTSVSSATPTSSDQDFSPEAFGIKTESIPNAGDIIGDFVVGPGRFEAFMNPGESRTTEILVTNRTGVDRRFYLSVEDIKGSVDGSDSVVLLGDDRGPYSIKDYISFPTNTFDLKHGQRVRVPVTISIPADAEPGGFYGSILTRTISVPLNQEEVPGSAVIRSPLVQRIGSLFFITVPGDNIYQGQLQDFKIVPTKKWYEKGPFNFVITYENTGSSHLNPYGEIRIQNMFGEEVGFIELTPWFALPQSVRLREVTWGRDMLYGKYTATILLNRGYDDIVDEMTYTFWVIPWKFVAIGFVGLFLIFLILRTFFKTFEFKRKSG